jgi:hypothetical protein
MASIQYRSIKEVYNASERLRKGFGKASEDDSEDDSSEAFGRNYFIIIIYIYI